MTDVKYIVGAVVLMLISLANFMYATLPAPPTHSENIYGGYVRYSDIEGTHYMDIYSEYIGSARKHERMLVRSAILLDTIVGVITSLLGSMVMPGISCLYFMGAIILVNMLYVAYHAFVAPSYLSFERWSSLLKAVVQFACSVIATLPMYMDNVSIIAEILQLYSMLEFFIILYMDKRYEKACEKAEAEGEKLMESKEFVQDEETKATNKKAVELLEISSTPTIPLLEISRSCSGGSSSAGSTPSKSTTSAVSVLNFDDKTPSFTLIASPASAFKRTIAEHHPFNRKVGSDMFQEL